ncbi:MAG: thioredoxin domain-containing protein, partial [Actinomycetota bacterium]
MNRLATETSPYLLQHADNPVDWYPWGEEALERARAQDRPILLSIGYAACHWCHVMERESFEDEATAALMNEHFVSIKVDREERPDLDAIYMDAVQAMTGHGGWPLTAFLTPDGRPFYAGTYFPNEDRHGMPAFRKVLTAIAETWATRRDEVDAQSAKVVEAISRASTLTESREVLSEDVAVQATRGLWAAFDRTWGGVGGAPKVPQPMTVEFLLRRHLRGDPDAHDMVTMTLDKMAAGGMHDQVGG